MRPLIYSAHLLFKVDAIAVTASETIEEKKLTKMSLSVIIIRLLLTSCR